VAVRRTGTETFRLCKKHLDDVITVTNDEICGAVKAIFDDTRAIAEPSGAVALAGLAKCVRSGSELTPAGAKLVAVLSGANVNFHTLRYVSERCAVGEHAEGMLAVTIPERPGSFLQLCDVLGPGRIVTEFNYRYSKAGDADIFLGVALSSRGAGADELRGVIDSLKGAGYGVADMTENELAKSHVRYMVGGRPPPGTLRERLLAFGFPERAGALRDFVADLGSLFNITLFHYRTTSEDVGRVLCAFEVPDPAKDATLLEHCDRLGFPYTDVSDDPAYSIFLK
jgi:threonine dehydratase